MHCVMFKALDIFYNLSLLYTSLKPENSFKFEVVAKCGEDRGGVNIYERHLKSVGQINFDFLLTDAGTQKMQMRTYLAALPSSACILNLSRRNMVLPSRSV